MNGGSVLVDVLPVPHPIEENLISLNIVADAPIANPDAPLANIDIRKSNALARVVLE